MISVNRKIRTKAFGCLIAAGLFIGVLPAQQTPVLNQSFFNSFVINPANAGLNNYTQLFIHTRDQWSAMPGAPFYYSLSADGRFVNEKSGIGFRMEGDKQPLINNISGMFTYRYTVKIGENHSLRMALSAGILYNSINLSNINAQSPTESALMQHTPSKAAFNADAGLVYKYKNFELGFAVLRLNNHSIKYENSGTGDRLSYNLIRHFNLSGSYRYDAGKNWNIVPSVILYSAQGMPVYAQASCMVGYHDNYRLGMGYRSDNSLAFSCGIVISQRLNIGYSFEVPVSNYASHLGNTHEVTLGIRLYGRSGEPVSGKSISQKDLEQLANIVQLQAQNIDELSQQTSHLQDETTRQKERYDSQKAELEQLIERSVQEREAVEQVVRVSSVTPEQLDSVSSSEKGRYLVVVGAYAGLEDAKLYQKILERELGLVTLVHARQSGKIRFLVYSRIVRTKQEAQAEYDRLYDMDIERYKQGTLWICPL